MSGKTKASSFTYLQNFSAPDAPTPGETVTYPLHFQDVGESNRLFFW